MKLISLPYVAGNLGPMFKYATACDFRPIVFWTMFVNSKVSRLIETGNPRYLTGYSARDFVDIIVNTVSANEPILFPIEVLDHSAFYWAGWVIAQYQWQSRKSFFTKKTRRFRLKRFWKHIPLCTKRILPNFLPLRTNIGLILYMIIMQISVYLTCYDLLRFAKCT